MEADIKRVVVNHFPKADVSFENDPAYGRVVGTVVLDDYEGKTQLERQTELWNALRTDLTDEQLLDIGLIMTLTHAELESIVDRAA